MSSTWLFLIHIILMSCGNKEIDLFNMNFLFHVLSYRFNFEQKEHKLPKLSPSTIFGIFCVHHNLYQNFQNWVKRSKYPYLSQWNGKSTPHTPTSTLICYFSSSCSAPCSLLPPPSSLGIMPSSQRISIILEPQRLRKVNKVWSA